jgi:hypothetical protein
MGWARVDELGELGRAEGFARVYELAADLALEAARFGQIPGQHELVVPISGRAQHLVLWIILWVSYG